MGAPDDFGVDSPTIPRDQDASARPRRERARSSSLGALAALEGSLQPPQAAVAQQEEVTQHLHLRDRQDGSASPSVGLGLSVEQRDSLDDGLSSLASSESSSLDLASTSSQATPLYHTPPTDSGGFLNGVDNALATPRLTSEPAPSDPALIPPSPTVPVSPTPTLHITQNLLPPPLNPLPVSAPNLSADRDKRGSLTLEERLSNLELSPPRLALVGEETSEDMVGASRRGVLPLPRAFESFSSSAEFEEKEQQGRETWKAGQATTHARLVEGLEERSTGSGPSTVSSSTSPSQPTNPSPRSSSSLGSSPSNPLPARPERSNPTPSSTQSPHPASARSLPPLFSPAHLTHSASFPSLRAPPTNLSPPKPTSRAEKRSSILSFVGFGSLGRKKGSALAQPPIASPPKMTRSPSAQSYEFGSSRSTLDGVQETDDDEYTKADDDFLSVEALPSSPPAPAAEVRLVNNKAAALLGLQAIGEGSPTSPPRSLPMSPSNSKDSARSNRSKLQRAGSSREEREKERRLASSGSETTTMHTYEHDPLPPFPCTLSGVLEHEIASNALYRHAPPEHHHASFLRSHHRPSSKDWRPQQLYLTSFPSPLSEPPTSIPSLHLFKTPAARNDREVARLELAPDSIVCVPEDESSLALGGGGKVNYALKITGLAAREMDERGRPVDGERQRTSWIVGMEKVEQMARWLKVLKGAVHDLQEAPSSGSPQSSITRSPSVETGLTERQRRDRESSWQSSASAQSSAASVASSMFFDSGPKTGRRPSQSSQTPSTTYSLSPPPPTTTTSPSSRKTSSAGLSFDDASHDPLPRTAPSLLYINAQFSAPTSVSADDAENDQDPGTAHPYRMVQPTPQPRPSSRDSHSKRLSVLSSPPHARPSEDSTSTSTSNTSSDPHRHPNRDSISLSSISSRTTSSSHKHPPRPPAPNFGLPPPPPNLPRSLPLPLPRTASDPITSRAEKRLSVMSTSTSASSNSTSSLRSRLSGAPLPPQLPPPPSTNFPLPPPPAAETPYKGVSIPLRVQRASTESISESREGGDETRKDEQAAPRESRSAPPAFAMGALPPPPPQFAMGALPPPPVATAPRAGKPDVSVKGLVKRWEGQ